MSETENKTCECPDCGGCDETATTTDEGGNDVCAACADYYTTEDGETVCSREQTDDSCRNCGTAIEWGPIQTGGGNRIEGRCSCREWRQDERGPGNWVLSEGAEVTRGAK